MRIHFHEITPEIAGNIWDILVCTCGASESMRQQFVTYMDGRPLTGSSGEFRFQGALGFGGKFYVNSFGECRVACYRENRTDETDAMIKAAMTALQELSMKVQAV